MMYNIPISRIMTTEVMAVGPNDTMSAVEELFKKFTFHHIPVLENDRIVGIISRSDYDKLCHSFTLFNHKSSLKHNENLMKSLLVSEVMTKQVIALNPEDTVQKAAAYFRENTFHAIPVVDRAGTFLGILTTYDMLNYAYMETEYGDEILSIF